MKNWYNGGTTWLAAASLALLGGCGKTSLDQAVEESDAAKVQAQVRRDAYMVQCRKEHLTEPVLDYCANTAGFYSQPKITTKK